MWKDKKKLFANIMHEVLVPSTTNNSYKLRDRLSGRKTGKILDQAPWKGRCSLWPMGQQVQDSLGGRLLEA